MKANNETQAVLDTCIDTLLKYEARQTNQIDFTKSKCMDVVLCLIEQSHSDYFHLYESLTSGKVDYIHIMQSVNRLRIPSFAVSDYEFNVERFAQIERD
jgi:hypothetical protein